MTIQQQNISKAIAKYGARVIFCALFYYDFVRPQGLEHIQMVQETRETQRSMASALQQLANTQQQTADSLRKFATLLEEYHETHVRADRMAETRP